MTVLMTFVGTIVFIFSMFTVGFKASWKRLMTFALTGLLIDLFIVGIALAVTLVISY